MLKTSRAYFCHTVAEGSPLSRITSTLFNQARQSFENIFRRSGRLDGVVPKQPVLKQYGGKASSGGIVAQIHANSRGLITKFAERNLTSELVNTMKAKYGWSGGFRSGIWGQRLSTFAFVGIGVAAGAQWNTFEGKMSLHDQLPYIVSPAIKAERAPEGAIATPELPKLPLEMPLNLTEHESMSMSTVVKAPERAIATPELSTLPIWMPLNLTEHESLDPSFILLDELSFDDGEDSSFTENQEVCGTSDNHFAVTKQVELESEIPESLQIVQAKEKQDLLEQLNLSHARIEEQRGELYSLQASLIQLNDLLQELVGPSDFSPSVDSTEPSFIEIEALSAEDGDLRGKLVRNLSVIGQQQLQLSSVKEQLLLQHQQLQDLCEAAAAARPTAIRSSFCKRDACCGPGGRE